MSKFTMLKYFLTVSPLFFFCVQQFILKQTHETSSCNTKKKKNSSNLTTGFNNTQGNAQTPDEQRGTITSNETTVKWLMTDDWGQTAEEAIPGEGWVCKWSECYSVPKGSAEQHHHTPFKPGEKHENCAKTWFRKLQHLNEAPLVVICSSCAWMKNEKLIFLTCVKSDEPAVISALSF